MDYVHHLAMSPFVVGFLGVLGGAIIVAFCHTISIFCNGGGARNATSVNGQREEGRGVGGPVLAHAAVQVIVRPSGKEEVCPVCLGEFKEGEEVRVLRECSHVFHVACIDKWLEIHPNCPLCRASASGDDHAASFRDEEGSIA